MSALHNKFAFFEWDPRWNRKRRTIDGGQGLDCHLTQDGSRVSLITVMGEIIIDLKDTESVNEYIRTMKSALDHLAQAKEEFDKNV